jgi:hypothetical protein
MRKVRTLGLAALATALTCAAPAAAQIPALTYALTSASVAVGQLPPVIVPPTVPGAPNLTPPDAAGQNQTPAPPQRPIDPLTGRPMRALTPEEEREREIEKYDPTNPVNPAKPQLPGEPDPADPRAQGNAQQTNRDSRSALPPLPGSIAESQAPDPSRARGQGPDVVSDSDPSSQTYSGPAVLSRSYTLERPIDSKQLKWSWSVTSGQSYSTGLVTGAANPATAKTNASSYGNNTGWSVSGSHAWKKDQLSMSYSVSFSDYPWASNYSGINQSLSLGMSHQFSRRLTLHLTNSGSISPPSVSLSNPLTTPGVSVANLNLANSPLLNPLDTRSRQFQTGASLTWQKSMRLSFSLQTGFFAVAFTGPSLTGNIGYSASADVNYRLDSKTTIGAAYSWGDYIYAQHQTVSASQSAGLIFSRSFGRSMQFRSRIGIGWVSSQAYTQVPINPIFVPLIGATSALADLGNKSSSTDISAQFVKDFRGRRTASISYARGVSPGNGLILTSIQETVTANFSTMVFRRFPLSMSGGRSALASQAQNTGGSIDEFFSLSTSHTLTGHVTSSFSVQYSKFSITSMPGLNQQFMVSTGMGWSPGPGKIW